MCNEGKRNIRDGGENVEVLMLNWSWNEVIGVGMKWDLYEHLYLQKVLDLNHLTMRTRAHCQCAEYGTTVGFTPPKLNREYC